MDPSFVGQTYSFSLEQNRLTLHSKHRGTRLVNEVHFRSLFEKARISFECVFHICRTKSQHQITSSLDRKNLNCVLNCFSKMLNLIQLTQERLEVCDQSGPVLVCTDPLTGTVYFANQSSIWAVSNKQKVPFCVRIWFYSYSDLELSFGG